MSAKITHRWNDFLVLDLGFDFLAGVVELLQREREQQATFLAPVKERQRKTGVDNACACVRVCV